MQDVYHYEQWSRNVADGKAMLITNHEEPKLNNRSAIFNRDEETSEFWELSQVSAPPGADWMNDERIRSLNNDNSYTYKYYYHESEGEGQYVYILEDGIWEDHPVRFWRFLYCLFYSLFSPQLFHTPSLPFRLCFAYDTCKQFKSFPCPHVLCPDMLTDICISFMIGVSGCKNRAYTAGQLRR